MCSGAGIRDSDWEVTGVGHGFRLQTLAGQGCSNLLDFPALSFCSKVSMCPLKARPDNDWAVL